MATSDFEIAVNEHLANYSLDTDFYMRDGYITSTYDIGPEWFNFLADDISSKPSNKTYASFRMVDGVTRNAGIKSRTLVAKHENIALEFSIFRPKNMSRLESNAIEDELDSLFLNWEFSGGDWFILADTANPKRSLDIQASGDDIESIKQIQYRFIYRYG